MPNTENFILISLILAADYKSLNLSCLQKAITGRSIIFDFG